MDETDMADQGNDVWIAQFTPPAPGRYRCEIAAWVDHFESWRKELERREDCRREDGAEVGAALVREAAARARGNDAANLAEWASLLGARRRRLGGGTDGESLRALALDPAKASLVARYPTRGSPPRVSRDRGGSQAAAFSSWYELFPRSARRSPPVTAISRMSRRVPVRGRDGFDVLYFPPIQPIGRVNRKGVNNSLERSPGRGQPVGHRIRGRRPQADPAPAGVS